RHPGRCFGLGPGGRLRVESATSMNLGSVHLPMNPIPRLAFSSQRSLSRRQLLRAMSASAGAGAISLLAGCEQREPAAATGSAEAASSRRDHHQEEYVWLSANANLPLFTTHDHPALRLAGEELGVQVAIAGPNSVDIPGLVAALEQTAARRPAGL